MYASPQQPAQAPHPRAQLPEPESLIEETFRQARFLGSDFTDTLRFCGAASYATTTQTVRVQPCQHRNAAGQARHAPRRRVRSRRAQRRRTLGRQRRCASQRSVKPPCAEQPAGPARPCPAPTARANGPGPARRSPWWLNSLQILVKRIPILGPLRPPPAPPHPPPGAARGRGRLRARPGARPAGGAPRAGPARAAHCGPSAPRARTSPPPALRRSAPRAAPSRRPPAGTAPHHNAPRSSRPP